LNIVDVNSIQQNYIVNSKEIEIFAKILRLLLSIAKLLFNREAKEAKEAKEEKEKRENA